MNYSVTNYILDPSNNAINTTATADTWSITSYENSREEFSEYIGIDRNQSLQDFTNMCEKYPALEKALAQFKNTYNIVKDDWYSEKNKK